jgi:hypothetical protein
MSGPLDFTNENIENTYQRVLQTDGTDIYDGTGSLFTVTAVAAPAGPDQSVQFNDAGATSGSGTFTFNKGTSTINISGSLVSTGSILFPSITTANQLNVLTIDTASGQLYYTASSAFGGGTTIDTSSFVTTSSFNTFTSSYNSGSFTGSFTGSFYGTASWAYSSSQAISSSYATSASYALSSSYAESASYSLSSSYTLSSSYSVSSSFATTSSYILPLNQNIQISGSLKLDPTQDPDPTGIDLDSTVLFQSSSNTALGYDLYIRQNGNLVKWKWIEGILETGLLYGGAVTYSGSNVFVSPGSGIIADHNATTGSEVSPMIEYVTWNAITQSITNIATQQVTYLYIDNTGVLQQQSTRFTSQQYHDYIPLGAVGHFDYTQVSAFGGGVQTAYDQISQISNFVDAFGPLKMSGYGLTGQAGSLRLSVGSGISFIHGGFYQNNPEFPSQTTTPSQATASLARINRSGSVIEFDTNAGNLYTVVDPTKYDRDGDGTLANVGSGNWSIQRVFSDPKTGVLYVYYGQARYTSLLNALQFLPTDPFTEGDTFDFTTFIGFLVLKGNASDITDTADNSIINGGLFRGSGQGSGGGIALSTLEDLTDVSITSPTNGQALIYNAGIWQNGTPTSASYSISSSYSLSSSYAENSSYALNGLPAGTSGQILQIDTSDQYQLQTQLNDGGGDTSINFDGRLLYYQGGTGVALDYSKKGYLYGVNGELSIDFGADRALIDKNGTPSILYDERSLYYPDGNTIALLYGTQNQINISGSLFVSGTTDGGGSGHILTYNTSSGEIFFTASSAIGGGGSAFPFTGSAIITGSLIITGSTTSTLGFTGSLLGTASFATSASNAVTASYVLNKGFELVMAASDETTPITIGNAKITFRMPRAITLSSVRASLGTAQGSGSIFTVDINENGASILSTKITIDNTEKTSTTAVTSPVISDANLADDAEMTVDVDQVGDGTARGLKIYLIGSYV